MNTSSFYGSFRSQPSSYSLVARNVDHDDTYFSNDGSSPEQSLWRAVITQALVDASSNSKKRALRYEKARAISWLSGVSDDFYFVCALAGMEPSYVKKKAKGALRKNGKWSSKTTRKPRFLKAREPKLDGEEKEVNVTYLLFADSVK